jgi:hypothetical protein
MSRKKKYDSEIGQTAFEGGQKNVLRNVQKTTPRRALA